MGTKVEHNAWTGFEVQPSARLAWVPNERRTLWAAVSRAVRTPTRLDEELVFYDVEGRPFLTGSHDFKPEALLAYEIGYRLQPRTGVQIDLATFYNVYNDLRTVEQLPGGTQVLANRLNAETWGAELRASWQAAPWWRLHAAYAYFDKQLSLDPGSTALSGGRNEGNDPRSRLVLRSLIDLPGGFELDGTARYVARLPSPVVPAYTELDLRLGWNASDRLEVSLVGQNLLHARHPEFGAPSPLRREVSAAPTGR